MAFGNDGVLVGRDGGGGQITDREGHIVGGSEDKEGRKQEVKERRRREKKSREEVGELGETKGEEEEEEERGRGRGEDGGEGRREGERRVNRDSERVELVWPNTPGR